LRGADKNYVLMRLDAEGEHPYAVVYHEYTHLLLSKADWMPLWMNEGLAEFYQNTDIHEKDVAMGQPSPENLLLLRQSKLMPLPAAFLLWTTRPPITTKRTRAQSSMASPGRLPTIWS